MAAACCSTASPSGLPPSEICQRGLARSFQITNLFKGLSIYENLRLSLQARHAARYNMWRDIDSYPEIHAETAELMRFLGLKGIDDIEGGALSYGGQRLVDLGIALGSKPQVLLMDEPLAGLAAAERERVSRLVQIIAANIPVLIVEHDIDRVLGFSHQVTVMNQGSVLMAGTPEQARADQRVQEIYTGHGTPPVTGRSSGDAQERAQLLAFDGVNAYYGESHILNDASLEVRQGEIVALLGRNGAGKSTLLKTLTGLLRPASGTIRDGRDIAGLSAPDIARLGIGYVPQGRGLFAGMTVAENLALAGWRARTTAAMAWPGVKKDLAYFPRLKERLHTHADFLSGGEQQMVAVARAAQRRCCCWTNPSKAWPGRGAGTVHRLRPVAARGFHRHRRSTTWTWCWPWPTASSPWSAAPSSTPDRPNRCSTISAIARKSSGSEPALSLPQQGHCTMDLNLKEQKVIVTAGAQGIGLAITAAFVEAGAHVHICDVSEEFLASARSQFAGAP
jgi:ABC-type branched-subunit amino acid transport system ATPase component